MTTRSDRWWLLPVGILAVAMLLAPAIALFGTGERTPECSEPRSDDYECQRERYEGLVRDSGVGAAFTTLKREFSGSEFVRSVCHELAHTIGRADAQQQKDVALTFERGDGFCQSGFYHGAMETFVSEVGADKVLEKAPTICARLRGRSVYQFDCAHGLGHGFMGIFANRLFESLRACDALTDGRDKRPCYSGVFMQNTMGQVISGRPSKYLREDAPLYPCTVVATRYKLPCYRYQTTHVLLAQGGSFDAAFEICAAVPEPEFRAACDKGLGANAAGKGVREQVSDSGRNATIAILCALGGDAPARSNCVAGAANFLVYFYHDDAKARVLCETFDDSRSLRATCSREVDAYADLVRR